MWYRTGSISLTNGSTAVTGSGTAWILNASVGEAILAPDGKLYEIAAISSDTSITLASPYLGTTQSGQTYVVVPTQSYIRDLAAQAATLVNTYSTLANNAGAGKFGDGTAAAPGITFVGDQDTGFFRSANNEVTFVANGVAQFKYGAGGITFLNNTVTINGTALVKTDDARLTNSREWTASTVDQPEAEAGTATTRRAWTAQRVRQAIAAWWNTITNIDGKNIGATTAGTGRFTTLTTTSDVAIGAAVGTTRLNVRSAANTEEIVAQFGNNNIEGGLQLVTNGNLDWGFNVLNSRNFVIRANQSEVARATPGGFKVTSHAAVGGNPTGVIGLYVEQTDSSSTGSYGVISRVNGEAENTSLITAFEARPYTKAASYTLTNAYGYRVLDLVKGAGSNVTNLHGMQIPDLTAGVNNYGITLQVNAGTNKRNLNIIGTADNYLAGKLLVGTSSHGWDTNTQVTRIGAYLNAFSSITGGNSGLTYNLQYDGANWTYQNNLAGSVIDSTTDTPFRVRSAPTGTAGATATLTERLRITSTGNVGIGTSSPVQQLDMTGNLLLRTNSSYIVMRNASGVDAAVMQLNASNVTNVGAVFSGSQLALRAGSGEQVRITSTGDVGIGTSSPAAKLHVSGSLAYIGDGSGNGSIGSNSLAGRFIYSGAVSGSVSDSGAFIARGQNAAVNPFGVEIWANNAEALRVTQNRKLLIGTSAEAIVNASAPLFAGANANIRLRSNSNGAADNLLYIDNGADGTNAMRRAGVVMKMGYGEGNTAESGKMGAIYIESEAQHGSSPSLKLATANVDRIAITSTGVVDVLSGQIKFPATQNASADANTLDDYEEGSFTPIISGATTAGVGTYTTQTGRYTKIGKRVFIDILLIWTAHTGTGQMRVGGFPYTTAGFNAGGSVAIPIARDFILGSNKQLSFAVEPNATQAAAYSTDTTTGVVSSFSVVPASGVFRININYEAAT